MSSRGAALFGILTGLMTMLVFGVLYCRVRAVALPLVIKEGIYEQWRDHQGRKCSTH